MKRTDRINTADIVLKCVEALLGILIAVLIVMAVINLNDDSEVSGCEKLEEAVRKAAVACYTEEGVYPPDIEYIKQHYGVMVDEKKYTVHYTAYAENLMPVITVTEKSN